MAGPPDDWFPEGEVPTPPPGDSERAEDWLVEADVPQPSTFDLSAVADRRVLVPAALAVVFLIAVLAAFGVFNGNPRVVPPSTTASARISPQTSRSRTTTTTTTIAPPPTMTLKPGDIGPQVKILQRELKSLGFSVGAVDGSYGNSTTQAVVAFQRARGLKADGIVGPKTLQALSP